MLSLKLLLDPPDKNPGYTLDRVVSILLKGISRCAPEYDPAEFAAFQSDLGTIRREFETVGDADSAVRLAVAATQRFEAHFEEAGNFLSTQRRQMRDVLNMLTDSLVKVSESSKATTANLKRIENELEAASRIEDLSLLRKNLAECLTAICEEAEYQNNRNAEIKAQLKASEILNAAIQKGADIDPTTGLPGPLSAVRAIRNAAHDRRRLYVFACGIERLDSINMRFGRNAGNEVLLSFAQHVARSLPEGDRLFRWHGPALIALIQRDIHESMLSSEMAKIVTPRLEHTILIKSREVVLYIALSSALFRSETNNGDDILARLKTFRVSAFHEEEFFVDR